MDCDVKHVHFCVTSLVKLHVLAVVSAILRHHHVGDGRMLFVVGVLVVVASAKKREIIHGLRLMFLHCLFPLSSQVKMIRFCFICILSKHLQGVELSSLSG